jgi:hypothetical protein
MALARGRVQLHRPRRLTVEQFKGNMIGVRRGAIPSLSYAFLPCINDSRRIFTMRVSVNPRLLENSAKEQRENVRLCCRWQQQRMSLEHTVRVLFLGRSSPFHSHWAELHLHVPFYRVFQNSIDRFHVVFIVEEWRLLTAFIYQQAAMWSPTCRTLSDLSVCSLLFSLDWNRWRTSIFFRILRLGASEVLRRLDEAHTNVRIDRSISCLCWTKLMLTFVFKHDASDTDLWSNR